MPQTPRARGATEVLARAMCVYAAVWLHRRSHRANVRSVLAAIESGPAAPPV
ncbi:hypothetical protein ACIQM4_18520 [Streptomyces sp. NPDC091272]|uniref:hypothetical protein n=1 Tax=Streptomyces sp. NPDC091272 TaxID=3365981 RepID=UPI0038194555